jgi:hypothetical protein
MLDQLMEVYGEDRVLYSRDSRTIGEWIHNILAQTPKNYIILVKGSQNTIFLEE